jgi:lysophospholipase L1-like esterase
MLRGSLAGPLLLVLTTALLFVSLEVGSRIWLTHLADTEEFRTYASLSQHQDRQKATGESFSKYVPHNYIGYVGAPNFSRGKNRHNSLGYRGDPIPQPKPAGEYRIVCLGGSTTYTAAIEDHRLSYPSLLQAELHGSGYPQVRVVNAGAEGYSSYESLLTFQLRVLDLDPDMIIVYHAVNDVMMRIIWPRSAYKGDNSGALVHSLGLHRPVPLLQRSTALRILLIRLGLASSPVRLDSTLVNFAGTSYAWKFIRQYHAERYPSGIFSKISLRKMLEANPPIYFERNLTHLLLTAQHWGVQPVLATFAYSKSLEGDAMNSEEFAAGMEEVNQIIVKLGRELEAPVFDFASAFPDDPALFFGAVHVNHQGVREKARLFARYLIEGGLLPN